MLHPALTLLAAATANATGTAVTPGGGTNGGRHAPVSLYASGTFNGATVTIEASIDGVTYVAVPGLSMTAPTIINLDISASHIRAVIAGVGGSTSVTVKAV